MLKSWYPAEPMAEVSGRRYVSQLQGSVLASKIDQDSFIDEDELSMQLTTSETKVIVFNACVEILADSKT